MRATVTLSAGFRIDAPPQTPKILGVVFPTFGPFIDWGVQVGELNANQCSKTFDVSGSSVLFLALNGNATLEWDENPGTPTFNMRLVFCGLPPCPGRIAYVIPLPVCGIVHVRICAQTGCGVQFELGHFGVPAPVVS